MVTGPRIQPSQWGSSNGVCSGSVVPSVLERAEADRQIDGAQVQTRHNTRDRTQHLSRGPDHLRPDAVAIHDRQAVAPHVRSFVRG